MLYGRWPHELDRLSLHERNYLDRWYDRYIEVMYATPSDTDGVSTDHASDEVFIGEDLVVGARIG